MIVRGLGQMVAGARARGPFLVWLAMSITLCGAGPHGKADDAMLPRIGPAPQFTLIDQDGRPFSLVRQKGKVAVVTFIFTGCSDTCPLLTAKLVGIQRRLSREASNVMFTAITVDPLNDTPATLKKYAAAQSANLANFAFLTGTSGQVEDVAHCYVVFRKAQPNGSVDHAFLTSLVDRQGTLRVQYIGARFDPVEFEADLRSLLAEGTK
jgi:protein SCO1/2